MSAQPLKFDKNFLLLIILKIIRILLIRVEYINVKLSHVYIDNNVFIGTNPMILKWVHFRARSFIAAGTVVTI
jgi:acetyltransferase-like isoleucine patch superfamily enzyme